LSQQGHAVSLEPIVEGLGLRARITALLCRHTTRFSSRIRRRCRKPPPLGAGGIPDASTRVMTIAMSQPPRRRAKGVGHHPVRAVGVTWATALPARIGRRCGAGRAVPSSCIGLRCPNTSDCSFGAGPVFDVGGRRSFRACRAPDQLLSSCKQSNCDTTNVSPCPL